MNIIITAGGTTEKIDPIRKISNAATGKLGCLVAEEFVKRGEDRIEKIYYICEEGTIIPKLASAEVVLVENVAGVKEALIKLLTSVKIDVVIHSMAVSDYTVNQLTTVEELSRFIAGKLFPLKDKDFENESSLVGFIAECIRENDHLLDNSKKVGSDIENLMLLMKQTPKLIGMIKTLQPKTILVGFKLLNKVENQQLLNAGYEVLVKNSCDFVLANDLIDISRERHIGYLISPDKSYTRFETKEKIADGIVRRVMDKMKEEE